MEKSDICKLCFETFGDSIRPHGLPCGHSYCTDCLDKLIENGSLSCPKCKRNHRVSNAIDFPINYDLEEILSEVKNLQACLAAKTQTCLPAKTQTISKIVKMETLISEQKSSIHNIILAAEEIQSQLKGYDEFLLTKKTKHGEVLQKIRDLANLHDILVKETEDELQKIADLQKEGNGYSMEVNDKLPGLDNAMSNRAATAALTEIVEPVVKLEDWIERCPQEFPFPKIIFSQQVLMESMEALSSVVSTREEEVPMASSLSDNDLSITEKVARLGNIPTLTVDRLRRTPQHWKKQIRASQVYAVQSNDGSSRSAILSEENGKLYLHHLQDQDTPPFVHTIKHKEVVSSLDKESTVAFMDLAWDGSCKGRVHILLSPDAPLAQHFRMLCTGELGPSYAHSKFHEISYHNASHECIRGGDYEYGDGTGGAPVMEGLFITEDDAYRNIRESGIVYSTPKIDDHQKAQFTITTGSGNSNVIQYAFGKVQDGMDVLRAATRFRNITEVEIIDCGVVLPL